MALAFDWKLNIWVHFMNLKKYIGKKILNDMGEYFEAGKGISADGIDGGLTEKHACYLVWLCDDEYAERIGCSFFSLNIYVDDTDIIRSISRVAHQHFQNGDKYSMQIDKFSMTLEVEADEVLQYMV